MSDSIKIIKGKNTQAIHQPSGEVGLGPSSIHALIDLAEKLYELSDAAKAGAHKARQLEAAFAAHQAEALPEE